VVLGAELRLQRAEALNRFTLAVATRRVSTEVELIGMALDLIGELFPLTGAFALMHAESGLQIVMVRELDGTTSVSEPEDPALVDAIAAASMATDVRICEAGDAGSLAAIAHWLDATAPGLGAAPALRRVILAFRLASVVEISDVLICRLETTAGVLPDESEFAFFAHCGKQLEAALINARLQLDLERHIEDRTRQLLVAERKAAVAPFEREVAIARQIQVSILPRNVQIAGLEIAARMITADQVGGDYYDVLPTPDGGGWIGIGDVSGHGLDTGLIMLMMQSGLASLMRGAPDAEPRVLIELINKMLFDNVRIRLARNDFATLTLFRYRGDGEFAFAGAHEEIVIWRASLGQCVCVPTPGTWMAVRQDVSQHTTTQRLRLDPGDIMLLYTDGVTEARSSTREQFGQQRLSAVVQRTRTGTVDEIRDAILAAVDAWATERDDDRTLVVIRYAGPS
jgi:serine phosphatase RsbU (regulator of sigma subunit)